MDRKSKVWLIILAVLLIVAVALGIMFKTQLDASKANYGTLTALYEGVQADAAQLQTELDAANEQVAGLTTELETAQGQAAEMEAKAAEMEAKADEMEAKADEMEAKADEMEAKADEMEAKADEMEAKADEMEAKAAEQETKAGEMESKAAELEAKAAELEQLAAELEAQLLELESTVEIAVTDTNKAPAADVEATEAPAGTPAPSIVPEVVISIPEIDVENLGGRISEIMGSDVSDEEKLEAIVALETELNESLEKLSKACAALTEQKNALAEAEGVIVQMQSDLAAAEATVADLEAQLTAGNEQIATLEAQIGELNAQSESDAETLAGLEAQLTDAQNLTVELETALVVARADYETRVAELEAYMLTRALIAGEAHTSTDAAASIAIAADGVTGAWTYTNRTESGNSVVLSIAVDGETLYTSDAIAPGESISEITLTTALAAGSYDAVAVTTVCDAEGNVQFTSRVPVTLEVAE